MVSNRAEDLPPLSRPAPCYLRVCLPCYTALDKVQLGDPGKVKVGINEAATP